MALNRVSLPSPNHAGRGGAKVRLLVLHTTEGALSYQSLGSYFGASSVEVSSHVGVDNVSASTCGEYVARSEAAWAVAAFNDVSVSCEMCGFAAWQATDWAGQQVLLNNAAQWLAEESSFWGIPLVRLSAADAQGSGVGVCGHIDLGAAGGGHQDPGPNFPWDQVLTAAAGIQGGTSGTVSTGATAGQQAYTIAQQQLGKPYVWDTAGPDTFDCSGLMVYAYANGPGITLPHNVGSIWNNSTVVTTAYDVNSGEALNADNLQVGDMLIYMQPGANDNNQHITMYAGNGQAIQAPHTGAVVFQGPADYVGDTTEPFVGVKRPTGEGSGGGSGSGSSSGSSSSSDSSSGTAIDPSKQAIANSLALQDLPDPRNNLPFSPFFMGQGVAGGLAGIAGRTGSLKMPFAGVKGDVNFMTTLVRGGIVEMLSNTSSDSTVKLQGRKGGQFACYFMMNPQTVSFDCSMNNDGAAAPSQVNAQSIQSVPLMVQQQTITFDLIFNRMYEVWQGNVPGPSDIGVRWDIRSIERLMGMYDAQTANLPGTSTAGNTGLGNYGAGDRPPQALQVQVIIGGANSIQFQGLISMMNYTYTLFDSNMVPVEATVSLAINRQYMPQFAGGKGAPDIVSPMVSQLGQLGTLYSPNPQAQFNNQTGLIKKQIIVKTK